MTRDELEALIAEVQRQQTELEDLEVKCAREGTPGRLYEPLSAFANRSGGGVVLFGLDERGRFEIVGVKDAHRLQEELSHIAASEMEPALRPAMTVADFDGKAVVAVEIAGLPNDQKPCYYRPAGLQKGSYIRVANTNRVMTDYEIFGYVSARQQPVFDEEPVKEATLADLDMERLRAHAADLRRRRPRASYLNEPLEHVLSRCRIVQNVAGVWRPTLAGLLLFGKDPQQFEPQLVITFLQYYGTTETEPAPSGARFLDNRKFEGAIPELAADAVNHVMAAIRKSSLVEGLYRRDITEYPLEAVREAVMNAVAHRDYSHFAHSPLNDRQRLALAFLRQNPQIANGDYQRLNHVDPLTSGRELRELVQAGLLAPHSSRRWAYYTLKAPVEPVLVVPKKPILTPDEVKILGYVRENGFIKRAACQSLLACSAIQARHKLQQLRNRGLLRQEGVRKATRYVLPPATDAGSKSGYERP